VNDPLVLWTARLAVLAWAARWLVPAFRSNSPSPPRWALVSWTVGWVLHLVHLWAVFEQVHGWSHDAAWEHTADATERLTGVRTGAGVWLNYLFTGVLTWDVARLWIEKQRHEQVQPGWLSAAMNLFLAFLVLQSTVVFGPRAWWLVLAAWVILRVLFSGK
jgi:hypothetical protein